LNGVFCQEILFIEQGSAEVNGVLRTGNRDFKLRLSEEGNEKKEGNELFHGGKYRKIYFQGKSNL
jgi:hypothetical protein